MLLILAALSGDNLILFWAEADEEEEGVWLAEPALSLPTDDGLLRLEPLASGTDLAEEEAGVVDLDDEAAALKGVVSDLTANVEVAERDGREELLRLLVLLLVLVEKSLAGDGNGAGAGVEVLLL